MSGKIIWFNICFNILLLFDKIYASNSDSRQTFCGRNLAEILTEYCIIYHIPTEHRVRRQIVTECCYNKCSLKHLITNYCKTFSSKALEEYIIKKPEKTQTNKMGNYLAPHTLPQLKTTISHRQHQLRNNTGVKLVGESSGYHLSYKGNCRKHRGKRSSCKKHLTKRHKKFQRSHKSFLNKGVLETRMRTVPGPKMGNIEDSQTPIYVISSYQRLRKY